MDGGGRGEGGTCGGWGGVAGMASDIPPKEGGGVASGW